MKIINTFIIPVLNNYAGLLRLIETIEKHTPPNYRIIVINNGFDSGASFFTTTGKDSVEIDVLRRKVHLWIDSYRNLGFAKSMNVGIQLATTELVTCANDDVELMYDEWWDEVMGMFKQHPRLAGFNPHSPCNKQASGERFIQYEYKKEYTKEDIEAIKKIFHSEHFYVGCCTYFTIFKKELFDVIGLFDESFGQGSGEDYDLCVRAARADMLIAGGSQVIVWHWWGNTKDNMPKLDGEQQSNFDMIMGGVANMRRKWGEHIDKDPKGWTVAGKGGPDEPFDKDKVDYKDKKWHQIVDL